MKNFKKFIFILFVIIGIGIVFANIDKVSAFEDGEEITVPYYENIDAKKLEETKTGAFNVLVKPQIKVSANPTQEEVDKYYYNQLKHDVSKNTYNVMASELNNKVTINLNNCEFSIAGTTNSQITECFRNNLLTHIMDGYEAYIMDGEKNFWWTSGAQFGEISTEYKNGKIKFKSVEMTSKCAEWSDYQKFNSKLEETSQVMSGNTVYEIARSINYYICQNVEYNELDDTAIEQTAYGALIKNVAVCEGQAKLFKLMCKAKGIMCIIVYGYSNENSTTSAHAWNYVYEPSKAQWYAVDVTWNNNYNDPLYLMVGSNTVIKGTEFGKNHIPGFKQFENQTYIPASPVLASNRYIDPITMDGSYIKNIQPHTKYDDFVKEFSSDISFSVKEGENTITGATIIKTGQTFIIENNTFTLVVTGDVNEDGKADIKDILQINKHRLNKVKLMDLSIKAGDTNGDGKADIKDILQINKYRLKKVNEL